MARPSTQSGPGLFDDPEPTPRPAPDRSTPDRPAPKGGHDASTREGPGGSPAPPAIPTYTVGKLTAEITATLEELGRVRVEGELSGFKRHTSGHIYFDLKGDGARLSCVVWKSAASRAIRFRPEDGVQAVATGKLNVYAPRGSYNLIVDRLEPTGIGELLARLEALKAELKDLGWFDRQRPLPTLPERIGVVTSRDGAALRDFLRTRSLRWPAYPVRLCHAPVQGPGAAPEVADAIRHLDRSGVDVIVVCRGGGSLEDLWAFNERPVAEAIHDASVPVVSGVGHESDTTLADLVADHRAHTPTDAAQIVIPDRGAHVERMTRLHGYLTTAMARGLEERGVRLEALRRRRTLRDAIWILGDRVRGLDQLGRRLRSAATAKATDAMTRVTRLHARLERRSPAAWLSRKREAALRLGERLLTRGPLVLEKSETRIGFLTRSLESVSPLRVLARGYSITQKADGQAVTDATELADGEEVSTRLSRGSFVSRVTRVEPAGDDPATE